jgi:hypothetical protein
MALIRAKIHLKSGQTVIAHAAKFETACVDGNTLSRLTATSSTDYPLYLRVDDVAAITTEKRTLFGWKQF